MTYDGRAMTIQAKTFEHCFPDVDERERTRLPLALPRLSPPSRGNRHTFATPSGLAIALASALFLLSHSVHRIHGYNERAGMSPGLPLVSASFLFAYQRPRR